MPRRGDRDRDQSGDGSDEGRWIVACRDGDHDACARIVRAYQDVALRTAFLMTSDASAAEDIAQNAFLNALRALRRFDPDRPFRPWFLTILANEARMYLRSQRRLVADDDALEPGTPDEDSPVAQLLRSDERARVRRALMQMEEPFRTAVILHYFNDLSVDEIASETYTPAGTVKSRLFRGRQQLRVLLDEDDEPSVAVRIPVTSTSQSPEG